MSSDNSKPISAEAEKDRQIKQMIRNAARQVGLSEKVLSDAFHSCRESWSSGDFAYSELVDLAREIKYDTM